MAKKNPSLSVGRGEKLSVKAGAGLTAKGIEVKQLWEEEEPKFDIEGFVNSLGVDDETKQYIAGRLGDFDLIADKLKELIKLIQEAKKETINSYRESPEKKSVYGTDLAISILDRAIKLFT